VRVRVGVIVSNVVAVVGAVDVRVGVGVGGRVGVADKVGLRVEDAVAVGWGCAVWAKTRSSM
jgi:hypothetical protein